MGCSPSYKFKVNANIVGQDQHSLDLFHKLGLTDPEIDTLYTLFREIDLDGSGLIRGDEFFANYNMEMSRFHVAIFNLFDSDGNFLLNFLEFVCAVSSVFILQSLSYTFIIISRKNNRFLFLSALEFFKR